MSDNEGDSFSANDRDTEEIANMLSWPGPIEEGMISAGAIREIEENEDRFRRGSRPIVKRPPFTSGQKTYGILSVGLVIVSIAFFVWLVWTFIQNLTFGTP